MEQLEEPAAFPSWLSTIARNMVSDWYRKNGKDRENQEYQQPDYTDDGSAEDEIETIAEYRPDMVPDEYMDRVETARLMSEILGTLPEGQRIVLTMYYYDQRSLKEIAEELDLNVNTVKTRLAQGRKNVEAKIRKLEKKGTKLYGLAPVPFLLMLLKNLEGGAVEAEAAEMPSELMGAVREAQTISSVEHFSDTAAEHIAKTVQGSTSSGRSASTTTAQGNTSSGSSASTMTAQGSTSSGSSASTATMQGTAKSAGRAASKEIGRKAAIGAAVAVVAVGGSTMAVTKPWQDIVTPTVDLNQYVEVTFSGYDGYGTAEVTLDTDAIMDEYGKNLNFQMKRRNGETRKISWICTFL
ncbi:MAG: sigma-70 family RNA polymerase sigma factor [Lachnospiraceae bacterium]|nr:sigma-70 family RNA polymerase sigma factor [Lachnospiraceae bacterium]